MDWKKFPREQVVAVEMGVEVVPVVVVEAAVIRVVPMPAKK